MKSICCALAGLACAWAGLMTGMAAGATGQDAGKLVYDRHCGACHGVNGNGNGPAAVWLYPKPRNFNLGVFKIKSTPGNTLPTDQDLTQSVTRGLPGSSMPSFKYLTAEETAQVVEYVKSLAVVTNAAGQVVSRFAAAAARGETPQPVQVPPEPPITVQELALGQQMYQKMQCFTCHGPTGAGDGPQVPTLKDITGLPVRPRDFNTGSFRGGHTGPDLYLRIANGLAGTPMVPYPDEVLKPAERWALVHYVQSLRRSDVEVHDLLQPEDNLVRAARVKALPTGPLDAAWDRFDPARVPLNPLWPEPKQAYAVAVTAVHDGKRMAVLLRWKDDLPNGAPVRIQDFQDAAALQFSLSGQFGFIGMGDQQNPVNLWQWKAGWQAEAEGQRADVNTAYQHMHVDTYFASSYATGREANNPLSIAHRTPVEDAVARGFGSFQTQPPGAQNVQGKGLWYAGAWNVVFIRDLKSRDTDDVKLAFDKPVPVSFAVWNGDQGDRNGRKVISNWYQLVLEK
ncbi:MAG TPA: c-type cytochrome [Clostridia bacterium]|nr:c-type cytochrome [Clostridia bacterium]